MGTCMAPSYNHVQEEVDKKPSVWWRFTDDVFVIWPHSKGCVNEFLNMINNEHSTIKFTAEWSCRSVLFLDVKVNIHEGQLITDLSGVGAK